MPAHEVNFDALVGPTHNYAGLSPGNIASATHAGRASSPRAAALQGLEKMRRVMRLGLKQGVLPPHERPYMPALRALGFTGDDEAVLRVAASQAPALLSACCSASCMWAANAATVSASADTADGRVHLTPANLNTHFHRHLEGPTTTRVLRAIFGDQRRFAVHDPLPSTPAFSDEGAANFMRFARAHDLPGLEVMVYGRRGIAPARNAEGAATEEGPTRFPARQTLESCEAIARRHTVKHQLFIRQSPDAIDQGVFHNDVIAVANERVLFSHELAFAPGEEARLLEACRSHLGDAFAHVRVPKGRVSVKDAVASYLFNSQLLTIPSQSGMVLVAPTECERHPTVRPMIDDIARSGGPIREAVFVDVRQSMNNGGGPACLRLRVVLTDEEIAAMNRGVLLTDALIDRLKLWVETWYRESLGVPDLMDPRLIAETRGALDELTSILGLGPVYDFQRPG